MDLPKHFLLQKAFREHHNFPHGQDLSNEALLVELPHRLHFMNKTDCICAEINEYKSLTTNNYIGVDWLYDSTAIFVEPKLNDKDRQTDYLQIFFSALKHPEVFEHTKDLFEIKWDKQQIEITQEQDLLTPLLVVQFLRLMKEIVRKGLKKYYYKVEQNLFGRVKGKVMVSQIIKQNMVKNKPLNTLCSFDEFGLNNPENRLLKKALVFVQRFLPTYKTLNSGPFATEMFNYINPAFDQVSDEIDITMVKHNNFNAFYKEYSEAIRLAKLILKRFGYNITNTQQQTLIKTPPFWIDMSKLFELYVLGLLKDAGHNVIYQAQGNYGQPDYLLPEFKMIVDAKYKTYYSSLLSGNPGRDTIAADIRQLSGYSRDIAILRKLKIEGSFHIIPNCLIIYPSTHASKDVSDDNDVSMKRIGENKVESILEFVKFYKLDIKLPIQ